MAFDQTTRNRLQKFVSEAKRLLSDEFTRQFQNDYGMDPNTGAISDIASLTHLNDAQHQTAKLLRETMGHYQASSPGSDVNRIIAGHSVYNWLWLVIGTGKGFNTPVHSCLVVVLEFRRPSANC